MTGDEVLFKADWLDVLFVHFRVDPDRLARIVPLPLDLYHGEAFVSLVAFTQSRLRPSRGGRIAELLAAPLARHEFLNVRTYVRGHECETAGGSKSGIYFMTEWIPNRLAAFVGPRMYGLPYRLARLEYETRLRKVVTAAGSLSLVVSDRPTRERGGSDRALDDFLLERYTAFTHRNGVTRRFDVDHVPWTHERVDVDLLDSSLLDQTGDWHRDAELVLAHHSPGVRDVAISGPRRVGCQVVSATSDQ
jgi:uncharacterized protein YqjF (DUF2071 family)